MRALHTFFASIDFFCSAFQIQKLKEQVTKLYEKAFCVEEVVVAVITDVNAADSELSFTSVRGNESLDTCIMCE